MRMPALTLLFVVAAAPALAGQVDTAGRYVFVPIEAGTLRLDTATGEVSLCAGTGGETACTLVRDERRTEDDRAAALEARLAALDARVAALETRGGADVLADEESLDRVMALMDRMIRHFFGLVRDIRREMEGEEL